MFHKGDKVVGVADEFAHCPDGHDDDDDFDWEGGCDIVGKVFVVEKAFFDDHPSQIIVINGEEYCSAFFRKIEKAEMSMTDLIKLGDKERV